MIWKKKKGSSVNSQVQRGINRLADFLKGADKGLKTRQTNWQGNSGLRWGAVEGSQTGGGGRNRWMWNGSGKPGTHWRQLLDREGMAGHRGHQTFSSFLVLTGLHS